MIYLGLLALAVGLALPIAVLSAAVAMGKVGVAALEGIARQPEASSRLQTVLILSMALIESLVIYVLLTFFLLQGKLPTLTAEQLSGMLR
ncbi:MAG: ATP synthase F0 subunit C [Armatimonadetes bacterium]|nr:ATP synthase F0 subunit C [Armatimonadota bacterium]